MIKVNVCGRIVRMEIPDGCNVCPFNGHLRYDDYGYICDITNTATKDDNGVEFTYRPDFCPLPAVDIY